MKREHLFVIFAIVTILVIYCYNGSTNLFQEQSTHTHTISEEACNNNLNQFKEQYPGGQFPESCSLITTQTIDCLNTQCSVSIFDEFEGEWIWYGVGIVNPNTGPLDFCLYSCFHQQTDCNTNADSDCDGVVNRAELGSYINLWVSDEVTRIELGGAIQAWVK